MTAAARVACATQVVNYDALHARTLVAMAVALCGILTIFAPNVLGSSAAAAAATPAPVLAAFATPARHHTTVDSSLEHGHRNSASLSGALAESKLDRWSPTAQLSFSLATHSRI